MEYTDEGSNPGEKPQQCVGLMGILHKMGKPNTIMQVATRLRALDMDKLDISETYDAVEEAIRFHEK
jgi:hypothetical protein